MAPYVAPKASRPTHPIAEMSDLQAVLVVAPGGVEPPHADSKTAPVGLYSQNPINIYDGTYTNPKTLVLTG